MERKSKESKFSVLVKAIVFDKNENILTLKREVGGKEEWDLPGGQVMFGENVYNTVWRIVKEQTDLDVEIEGPSNVWTTKISEHLHTICISFRCTWYQDKFSEEEGDEVPTKHRISDKADEDFDEDTYNEDDEDDDPILLSNDFKDYEWLSPEDILEGDFPIWMKDEIEILEEE